MVITDDDELAYRAQLLSNHGRGRHYQESHDAELIGYNYRLSEVLSAIGRVQLRHVDDWNNERRTNTALYQELLAGRNLPVTITGEPAWGVHTRMRCVALVPRRDELVDHLRKRDIGVSPEYKLPIHLNAPVRGAVRVPARAVSRQRAGRPGDPDPAELARPDARGRRVRGRRDRRFFPRPMTLTVGARERRPALTGRGRGRDHDAPAAWRLASLHGLAHLGALSHHRARRTP